jgi:hypothetical protein
MNIHQLRHYSATELITAGVDIRTVAGRLGHGGGGSTTLRAYTAWVAESDQRAMKAAAVRMPAPPVSEAGGPALSATTPPAPDSPYLRIAADLRGAIVCGALCQGDALPTVEDLRRSYGVSTGTANRAVALLKADGLVTASRGRRPLVC